MTTKIILKVLSVPHLAEKIFMRELTDYGALEHCLFRVCRAWSDVLVPLLLLNRRNRGLLEGNRLLHQWSIGTFKSIPVDNLVDASECVTAIEFWRTELVVVAERRNVFFLDCATGRRNDTQIARNDIVGAAASIDGSGLQLGLVMWRCRRGHRKRRKDFNMMDLHSLRTAPVATKSEVAYVLRNSNSLFIVTTDRALHRVHDPAVAEAETEEATEPIIEPNSKREHCCRNFQARINDAHFATACIHGHVSLYSLSGPKSPPLWHVAMDKFASGIHFALTGNYVAVSSSKKKSVSLLGISDGLCKKNIPSEVKVFAASDGYLAYTTNNNSSVVSVAMWGRNDHLHFMQQSATATTVKAIELVGNRLLMVLYTDKVEAKMNVFDLRKDSLPIRTFICGPIDASKFNRFRLYPDPRSPLRVVSIAGGTLTIHSVEEEEKEVTSLKAGLQQYILGKLH